MKQPTMSSTLRKQYKGIIKTQNKKAIGYIVKQGKLFKKLKDNVDQSRSVKYFKISLYINKISLCIKNQPYNQVISKNNFKTIKVACAAWISEILRNIIC